MSTTAAIKHQQEVEVKLRLHSQQDYERVQQVLGASPDAVEHQTNHFLDGPHRELSAVKSVLRLRQLDKEGRKWTLTLKGRAQLQDGISRVDEQEEQLNVEVAQQIVKDPTSGMQQAAAGATGAQGSSLAQRVMQLFPQVQTWQFIGQFRTLRQKYHWQGFHLELDRTEYDFGGVAYEIEVETAYAQTAKQKLEIWLKDLDVSYGYSQRNKFVNMLNKSIL